MMTKEAVATIRNLKLSGVRFTIANEVESDIGEGDDQRTIRRIELHHYYRRLDGSERGHFVAELDLYGNMTASGPYLEAPKRRIVRQFNADGEEIR